MTIAAQKLSANVPLALEIDEKHWGKNVFLGLHPLAHEQVPGLLIQVPTMNEVRLN